MPKIKKRSGREEEFNRSKLERSITRAGVDEPTSRSLAERIRPRDGLTTSEIRRQVSSELKSRNTEASKRYESTRTHVARTSPEVKKDSARLHKDMLGELGVSPGETLELSHEGKSYRVSIEPSHADKREIHLHSDALKALAASEGKRVAVRRARA